MRQLERTALNRAAETAGVGRSGSIKWRLGVLLVLLVALVQTAGGGELPMASFSWTPRTASAGEHVPKPVPFRGGHGFEFSAAATARVNLSELPGGQKLRLVGPFTICAVLQLTAPTIEKCPVISKWRLKPGGRSYELGVMPGGWPYLDVSASGNWPDRAAELVGSRMMQPNVSYALAAVFEPGKRMALYINGFAAGEIIDAVPGLTFDSPTPVQLGAQPPGQRQLDAIVGELRVFDRALDEPTIAAWAKREGLATPPEPLVTSVQDGRVDLSVVRRQVLAYVDSLRVKAQPYGVYRSSARPGASVGLYAACDVAWTRACMGEDLIGTLTHEQRTQWIDHINSFANPDGTYPNTSGHSLEHANGMVIGALCVLGGKQKHPAGLYDTLDELNEIEPWLENIRWERQWSASHLFWGGMHCYSLSSRSAPAWRNRVFTWLDANLDPQSGWWRKGVPQAGRHIEVLGGAAHIWPIYQHHGHPFPYPKQAIDSILAMQRPDGSWLSFSNYMELDALYGLVYMRTQAPGYREDDIIDAARRHGRLVTRYWPHFLNRCPSAHIVLSVVGTLGLLQQLLPETFQDEVPWSDIFGDRRFYATSAVEVLDANGSNRKPSQ